MYLIVDQKYRDNQYTSEIIDDERSCALDISFKIHRTVRIANTMLTATREMSRQKYARGQVDRQVDK